MVEVVVDAKTCGGNFFGEAGLLEDVVVGASVDFVDAVALFGGALYFVAEYFWRAGAGPGRYRDCVALFLAKELVDGQVEVLAHKVV